MGKITLRNLTLYSYHGCFSEEQKIGSEYKLDVWIKGDFSRAEKTDDLSETIDYVAVSDIVLHEMSVPSRLIENVADRILSKILLEWPQIQTTGLIIKKMSPPTNAYVNSVEYRLEKNR